MKYNEFGEVISVNGLTTGQHLGTPLQDACPAKPEDNEPYAIAKQTVGNCENTPCDVQPTAKGGASSWNDLKDKPFYVISDAEQKYYSEETTFDGFTDNNYFSGVTFWDNPLSINGELVIGRTYTVVWDGVEYQAELCEGEGCLYFGHCYYWDKYWGSDLPFGILFVYSDRAIQVIQTTDEGTSHTLAICETIPAKVKQIDAMFVPNSVWVEGETTKTNCDIAVKVELGDNIESVTTMKCDYASAVAKIKAGIPVYCYYSSVRAYDDGRGTYVGIVPAEIWFGDGEQLICFNAGDAYLCIGEDNNAYLD